MLMRNILLSILFVVPALSPAQATDDLFDRAESACLFVREAVAERSADKVMQAMERISEIPFRQLTLTPVDAEGAAPLRGHLQFNAAYLDSLLLHDLDMGLIQVEGAFAMRGGSDALRCAHHAVESGHSLTFTMQAAGMQRLLVVAESGGLVNLYVDDETNGRRLDDATKAGKAACRLDWTLEKAGTLRLTVENKSNRAVSFIVVSN